MTLAPAAPTAADLAPARRLTSLTPLTPAPHAPVTLATPERLAEATSGKPTCPTLVVRFRNHERTPRFEPAPEVAAWLQALAAAPHARIALAIAPPTRDTPSGTLWLAKQRLQRIKARLAHEGIVGQRLDVTELTPPTPHAPDQATLTLTHADCVPGTNP